MDSFVHGLGLQWKLDLRSRTAFVTCYVVPLAFFFMMSGIFVSVLPDGTANLTNMMAVFAISMGALIGVPPTVAETYRTDVKNTYVVNGVPLWQGLLQISLSSIMHLLIVAVIISFAASALFRAEAPSSWLNYLEDCTLLAATSVAAADIIGLLSRDQATTSAISILIFLPSILLSGIMFPPEMLPKALEAAGNFFPATWGYRLLESQSYEAAGWLVLMMLCFCAACAFLLRRLRSR